MLSREQKLNQHSRKTLGKLEEKHLAEQKKMLGTGTEEKCSAKKSAQRRRKTNSLGEHCHCTCGLRLGHCIHGISNSIDQAITYRDWYTKCLHAQALGTFYSQVYHLSFYIITFFFLENVPSACVCMCQLSSSFYQVMHVMPNAWQLHEWCNCQCPLVIRPLYHQCFVTVYCYTGASGQCYNWMTVPLPVVHYDVYIDEKWITDHWHCWCDECMNATLLVGRPFSFYLPGTPVNRNSGLC